MTGKKRAQSVTLRMWTAVGAMVGLSLSIKSTIQLSRLVMINSESMGREDASGSDVKVSEHPDLEVSKRCEVGDLLIVSVGRGALTSGASGVVFSAFSFRLNANFGFVPVEVWLVCSFSKACSHDLSCWSDGCIINGLAKGIEGDWYHIILSLIVSGEERTRVHELLSQEGQLGRELGHMRAGRGG